MSLGRKKDGDMHNIENKLLLKSGMIKNNKYDWVINHNYKFKNENYTKIINDLKLIIYQRCMRHRIEGWKDLKNGNFKYLKNHRKAINWFLTAMNNIINNI